MYVYIFYSIQSPKKMMMNLFQPSYVSLSIYIYNIIKQNDLDVEPHVSDLSIDQANFES